MRVPTTQGTMIPSAQAQQGPTPSPEALLMAAAQIYDKSDFFKGAQDMNQLMREIPTPKEQTRDTLERALGVNKVLPIRPK